MDFFVEQESLTSVQWILRAIVGFLFFLIVAKLMGQRSMSQVGFLDFAIVLIIGNIIAHPLSDEGLGLKGSMITISILLILYSFAIILSLRSLRIRKLFVPTPIPLIENGEIIFHNLKKARISIDILQSLLRKEKVEDIQKVALALWEPDGKISVFLKAEQQPLTPATYGKPPQPFYMPKTVIKERKIDFLELKRLGKDEQWLLQKLLAEHGNISINDILLATVDRSGKVNVFLYHSSVST